MFMYYIVLFNSKSMLQYFVTMILV